MQDGARKPHRPGDSGIAMQRIAVARQCVKKSLVGPGVAFHYQIRLAVRDRMRFGLLKLRAAKAAIAAQEIRRGDGAEFFVAAGQAHFAFLHQNRALARTLVVEPDIALIRDQLGARRPGAL